MDQTTNKTQETGTEAEKTSGGIKKKFTSRKFLLSLVGIVTGICGIIGCNNDTTAVVAFVVLEVLSIVAYLICEGRVDAAAVGKGTDIINEIVKAIETFKDTGKADIPEDSTGKDIIDSLPDGQRLDSQGQPIIYCGQESTGADDGTFMI